MPEGSPAAAAAAIPANPVRFRINDEILTALRLAPRLGSVPVIQGAEFWQAEVRANPGVDFAAELLRAESWMVANPQKAPKRDFPRFLHNWFSRSARDA